MSKIYTKKGDKGETSLWGGVRVPKYSLRVETYGTVDELDSLLGVVGSKLKRGKIKKELEKIQHDLLLIGSTLANPQADSLPQLSKRVEEFELLIDELTEKMPVLRNFILPGGGEAGALLHFARTLCRRVERRVVQLNSEEGVDEHIIKYFNRFSDLLFTLARFMNYSQKKKETIWKK